MNIFSAADEAYVPHFSALLHSIHIHAPEACVSLLDCGISEATRDVVREYAERLRINLTLIPVAAAEFAGLPVGNWSAAIYARLLIPSIAPDHMAKALYLDADCVVTGDLRELWDIDLSDRLLAGAADPWARDAEQQNSGVNISDYVNNGVLLFNLSAWREEAVADAAISCVRDRNLIYFDQTAINAVCAGRILVVSKRWNLMMGVVAFDPAGIMRESPRIVHYTGAVKPWHYKDAPLGVIYRAHRGQGPFSIPAKLKWHRSPLRRVLNMMVLRPKYWRRFCNDVHCRRTFIGPYLQRLNASEVLKAT